MKNEKYQQALDIVIDGTGIEDAEDSATVYERAVGTLQELVDMMKPLTINEFENMQECQFFYDAELKMLLPFHGVVGGTMDILVSFDKSMKVVFEQNRFYRNIWEIV